MLRLAGLFALVASVYAQTGALVAPKPPEPAPKPAEKVDKALRGRVSEFYKFAVAGRYRDADSLVAKDSKDFFFSSEKPRILSFDIQSITYSEKFTRAKVVLACERYIMMPGFADRPMKVPMWSTWKLEKGKWYWYADMEALSDSPFGKMKTGPVTGGAPAMPAIPTSPDFALRKVTASPDNISLKPGQSAQVAFTNTAPGLMTVVAHGVTAGFEVEPKRLEMKAGEKASITIKALEGADNASLSFRIEPTGEMIEIKVAVSR